MRRCQPKRLTESIPSYSNLAPVLQLGIELGPEMASVTGNGLLSAMRRRYTWPAKRGSIKPARELVLELVFLQFLTVKAMSDDIDPSLSFGQ